MIKLLFYIGGLLIIFISFYNIYNVRNEKEKCFVRKALIINEREIFADGYYDVFDLVYLGNNTLDTQTINAQHVSSNYKVNDTLNVYINKYDYRLICVGDSKYIYSWFILTIFGLILLLVGFTINKFVLGSQR